MSHDVIGHISLNEEVVNPVSREGSVGRVMDGAVPHVGAVHRATQVEVDGIAAQTESLSHEPYLGMFDSI